MNREAKKRQLRNNIVHIPNSGRQGRDYIESDGAAEYGQRPRRKRPRFLIPAILVVFLAALGFCLYKYQSEYQYTEYDVVWEKSMRFVDEDMSGAEQPPDGGANSAAGAEAGDTADGQAPPAEEKKAAGSSIVNFAYYGDNMIKYTKDGAAYYKASGEYGWRRSYEMKSPIISVNGDYAVIADKQGNDLYIFGKEGCTGSAKTQLPITKVAVSAKGLVAAMVEDGKSVGIVYFKKDGAKLKLEMGMLLSGDGFPIDMALSPDGKQIVLSVMYLKNGTPKCKVVFYDFSEIGKNISNRLIGGFEEEFEGKIAARVRYMNQDTVCAFTDKGLSFISVKDVIPDANVITVPVEERIRSICYSDQYAGVVVDNPSGDPCRLDVYKTDGSMAGSIEFDYSYSGVEIDGDSIILYNDESCRVYNLSGNKKFESRFDFPVFKARLGRNHMNTLIVAGSEMMKELKLK